MKYALSLIALYPAYLLFIFIVDMRIESLRKPIVDNALRVAAEQAVATYEKKRFLDESELQKKRKIRDEKLRIWVRKLDEILEMKNENDE